LSASGSKISPIFSPVESQLINRRAIDHKEEKRQNHNVATISTTPRLWTKTGGCPQDKDCQLETRAEEMDYSGAQGW
jgi:hypothetical protein